jgi:hypothetical protein
MLKELDQYEHLGSPKFFSELFIQLNGATEPWTREHVKGYFYNRIIDSVTVFDGCIPLAEAIGAVIISDDGAISLNPSLVPALINDRYLSNKFLEMLLVSLREDEIFHEIFCSKNISYDIIYKLIQVDKAAFKFRHSGFRQLLVDFAFLYPHPDRNIKRYIINSKYKKFFDREVMPEIKRRKMGVDQLELLLERKQIHGEEAEAYALEYEKRRLSSHANLGRIEIISGYDVAAGYDIVSYEDLASTEIDRFIEVKSFAGVPSFHWSRNEMDVAKVKGDTYFLYLVDRIQMKNPSYTPLIIQNPHLEITDQEWVKVVDSYTVVKK